MELVCHGLETFFVGLDAFRPAFTRPGFDNMGVICTGWVMTNGPHAVTQALVATQVAGRRHHEAFHRFFSRLSHVVHMCSARRVKRLSSSSRHIR